MVFSGSSHSIKEVQNMAGSRQAQFGMTSQPVKEIFDPYKAGWDSPLKDRSKGSKMRRERVRNGGGIGARRPGNRQARRLPYSPCWLATLDTRAVRRKSPKKHPHAYSCS